MGKNLRHVQMFNFFSKITWLKALSHWDGEERDKHTATETVYVAVQCPWCGCASVSVCPCPWLLRYVLSLVSCWSCRRESGSHIPHPRQRIWVPEHRGGLQKLGWSPGLWEKDIWHQNITWKHALPLHNRCHTGKCQKN